MKNLVIMRHAKSSYPPDVADDFDRPLSRRGRDDAPTMGRVLAAHGPRPEAILGSAATRAAQTAAAVAAALGRPDTAVNLEQRLYMASPEALSQAVAATPDSVSTLLVVAHNPGVEEWVTVLCGAEVRLPTAALAAIELPVAGWRAIGTAPGRLCWLVTPRLVRNLR